METVVKYYSSTVADVKNFRPSLLRFVNNYVECIYKTQKTRTKVLPSAMVGECTFGIAQSCDFKKLKVYETKQDVLEL